MRDRRELIRKLILGIVYFATVVVVMYFVCRAQFRQYMSTCNQRINAMCSEIHARYPQVSVTELQELLNSQTVPANNIFAGYGIDLNSDSIIKKNKQDFDRNMVLNSVLLLAFILIPLGYMLLVKQSHRKKIKNITTELENINRGNYKFDMNTSEEGDISILESELYKTAIKLKEAADNSQKDKEQLKDSLSNISHQLKTPLTSLLINLENLEEYPDIPAEKRNEIIGHARRDVNRVNQMVQLILKLSKMDADAIQFDRKETLISTLIENSIENVAALSELRGIDILVDPSSDSETILNCDPYWETEAISNLLKNGIEHAESSVRICYRNQNLYKEIIVENDGAPLTSDEAANLFKRFYSGETATPDSTGIGLSLADSIVKRDSGYIFAEGFAEDGKTGSRFIVRFL